MKDPDDPEDEKFIRFEDQEHMEEFLENVDTEELQEMSRDASEEVAYKENYAEDRSFAPHEIDAINRELAERDL